MEMIVKKEFGTRRRLLAILFGVCAITSQASQVSAAQTEYPFDVPNLFGRTIDSSDVILVNKDEFTSEEPFTTALYILGDNVRITQRGDILLTGNEAVGIRIDSSESKITLRRGTQIISEGLRGKGILIRGGNGHNLIINGNIFAAGNAIEVSNSAQVDNISLTGELKGNAIYIGKNSSVTDIDLNKGAYLVGDITSKSDGVTNLNFNASMDYNGNISGAENIKLHVNAGTLNFSGKVDVVNVEVMKGANLFGGTFKVDNAFINHGTIGAGSADTNLIIKGDLISNGTLKRFSGGSRGLIIVRGNANVEGSTVTTDSLLPNETATVLIANSITGKIKNDANNPVPISAMLTATGKVVGNTLIVTTHEVDNLKELNSNEATTLDAMKTMFKKLDGNEQNEMRELYNLNQPETKHTLMEIGSNDSAKVMSVAQQGTAIDNMIADRIGKIFMPDYIDLRISPMNFADGDNNAPDMTVKVKAPSRQENNFWLNYMKNWGELRGGTDYHGSVIVGGYDRPINKNWRAGVFATYGTIGYSANSSRATVYDTRLGLYAGYHNKASDVYLYVNGGQLRNSLHRGIYSLGLSTNANYKSHIAEIGGEYKYDLQPRKVWHVSPFINFQTSHLRQNGYQESGAGIYNQHVDANSNTYFATQAGFDLKRYYRSGMLGLRFGVKHGFTGVDPDLRIRYEGDNSNSYHLRQERDKTHFVLSLRGEEEFARGWFMGGEAELQLGENDRDVTASLMLRRTW